MNHKDPFSTMPNNSTISSNNIASSIGNASKITTVLANYGVTASEDDSENSKFDGASKISHKTNIPDTINTDTSNSNNTSIINTNELAREISYTDTKVIGNGSFGVVFQAKLVDTGELVAIKKVLQDKRFKNRELQIMKELNHCNIVKLRYYFYCTGEKKDDIFLNLVLEYVPETVYRVARHYSKSKLTLPLLYVKLYLYQLFRALAYIHYKGICHRDIKPQNLLLDPETSVLKLCDFGSAKQLVRGEPNVSYICSRYYRAPELIFGATDYSWNIDVWSAGCVLAELMLGHPLFPGDSGVDQLVEIIKILGTPSREQIREMNPNYTEFKFPQIKPHPWSKVFRNRVPPEAIELVSKLLEYIPSRRLSPLQACAHAFFDELRNPNTKLPNGAPLPPLFNFTPLELSIAPSLNAILVPPHYIPATTTPKGDKTATGSNSLNRAAPNNTTSTTSGSGSMPASLPNTGNGESQNNPNAGGSNQLTHHDDIHSTSPATDPKQSSENNKSAAPAPDGLKPDPSQS